VDIRLRSGQPDEDGKRRGHETLAYDPEGRLVKTTVNGTDTVLMYDGQNLAAEYNSAGTMTRRYVFGPGVDAPLVQYEGAGTTSKNWLYANQQGSVVALANASGATTGSQGYGPFGETGGTPASRFGYTGQQYLAPLGLYYYKARMYSPTMGRFLQTDPVGYKDDLNWYAYVGNNPVNLTDPSGMIALLSGNFASSSTAASNVAAQSSTGGAKLDSASIVMPNSDRTESAQQLAASTNNPNYAAKMLGYERVEFGGMIHQMKAENNLRGDDNVIWHDNGDVYFKGVKIDNMHNY
jgi:RHS repeat-associated protein